MITLISPAFDVTAYPLRILSAYLRQKGFGTRLIFFPDRELKLSRVRFDKIL